MTILEHSEYCKKMYKKMLKGFKSFNYFYNYHMWCKQIKLLKKRKETKIDQLEFSKKHNNCFLYEDISIEFDNNDTVCKYIIKFEKKGYSCPDIIKERFSIGIKGI